ncbi:uncharacterized protein MONBRDRAFT_25595 [Monosiga brevicollis MX1]|uniref:Uncharacterized protein n=1 Tax=Monosiga brevicollis TaxID=81824 RepID=A9UZW0_MONBE|nr:uncharacterized protein MONBRDRAFT_25595 [Monosiga brevicollis MX1]EDQ89434.1 predicted protein [Monosiga brevicollis MX1]|eukprot:XP_001746010.1 hypothetical protein [Monosiga brevicollis MX1]
MITSIKQIQRLKQTLQLKPQVVLTANHHVLLKRLNVFSKKNKLCQQKTSFVSFVSKKQSNLCLVPQAQRRRRADQAFELFQLALQIHRGKASAEALESLLQEHGVSNITRSTLTTLFPSSNGRAPSSRAVAHLYKVTDKEIRAARGRAVLVTPRHDGRTIMTAAERELLAQHIAASAQDSLPERRAHVASVMRDLLEIRRELLETAKRNNLPEAARIPALTQRERSFLARCDGPRASSKNSQRTPLREHWFEAWEHEYGLDLKSARPQTSCGGSVAAHLHCGALFDAFGKALQSLGFLDSSGPQAGSIRNNRLCHIWYVDKMSGLGTGFEALHTTASNDQHSDPVAMAGKTHNCAGTVVTAIALGGALAPPLFIHKQATLPADTVAASVDLPATLVTDTRFQHFASCANKTGCVTRRLFLAFCRRLRAFTGHTEPLLLLCNGRQPYISAALLTYLRTINIFLFAVPSQPGGCLDPGDQWHQHVSRDRLCNLACTFSFAAGQAVTLTEEHCALYAAIQEQSHHPERIVAAWAAAGITRAHWGWELANNPLTETACEMDQQSSSSAARQASPVPMPDPGPLDPASSPRTLLCWAKEAYDYIQAARPLLERCEQLERKLGEIEAAAIHEQNKRVKVMDSASDLPVRIVQTSADPEAPWGDFDASVNWVQTEDEPDDGVYPSFDFWHRDLPDTNPSTMDEPSAATSLMPPPFAEGDLDQHELAQILQACEPATRAYRNRVLCPARQIRQEPQPTGN